ncbi:hypothetical protein [Lactobacillus sp. CBA3605]|uniref:hypothetical protein n=1 Tax=Lactobacillus sp. CBA3605 TaxID=2099788 RepID=UPI00131A3344|nr:hypothetical protein [Lactobacillus sp. CBA3605]
MQADTHQHLQELTKQGRWGAFINVKMQNLMSAAYGYNWTLYNLNSKRSQQAINRHWYQLRGPITLLSFNYLGLLLVGALISILVGLWTLFSSNDYRSANCFFFETLLLIGLTISTLCLEVQGRYQIVLYIPIIMLIGTGLAAIKVHKPDNPKSNK